MCCGRSEHRLAMEMDVVDEQFLIGTNGENSANKGSTLRPPEHKLNPLTLTI